MLNFRVINALENGKIPSQDRAQVMIDLSPLVTAQEVVQILTKCGQ
jgi:hypothetical protein